jgi:hypothetical protein
MATQTEGTPMPETVVKHIKPGDRLMIGGILVQVHVARHGLKLLADTSADQVILLPRPPRKRKPRIDSDVDKD